MYVLTSAEQIHFAATRHETDVEMQEGRMEDLTIPHHLRQHCCVITRAKYCITKFYHAN